MLIEASTLLHLFTGPRYSFELSPGETRDSSREIVPTTHHTGCPSYLFYPPLFPTLPDPAVHVRRFPSSKEKKSNYRPSADKNVRMRNMTKWPSIASSRDSRRLRK